MKPLCRYGTSCYRKNPAHFKQYSHNFERTVTVINESSFSIESHELVLGYKSNGNDFSRNIDSAISPKGCIKIKLELLSDLDDQIDKSWYLGLRKTGFNWSNGFTEEDDVGQILAAVEPGGTYTIVMNNENPPLSEKSKFYLAQLVIEELQQGTPFNQVWLNVHGRTHSNIRCNRNTEQLIEAYDTGPSKSNWQLFYKPLIPENWISQSSLNDKELVLGGKARIDVYYRALDRYPGGNADFLTVCYTFDCATTSVVGREYLNGDGYHSFVTFRPEKLSRNLNQILPELLNSLKDIPRNSECTLLDSTSRDSDEYDTEWSSQEIVVFMPRCWTPSSHTFFPSKDKITILTFLLSLERSSIKLPTVLIGLIFNFLVPVDYYVPVMRLHRHCIMGEQWDYGRKRKSMTTEIKPSTSQLQALSEVDKVIGMGRVNEFSDAGDGARPCPARLDVRLDVTRKGTEAFDLPYLQPMYFNTAALHFK